MPKLAFSASLLGCRCNPEVASSHRNPGTLREPSSSFILWPTSWVPHSRNVPVLPVERDTMPNMLPALQTLPGRGDVGVTIAEEVAALEKLAVINEAGMPLQRLSSTCHERERGRWHRPRNMTPRTLQRQRMEIGAYKKGMLLKRWVYLPCYEAVLHR